MADASIFLVPVFTLPVYCFTHIIYGAWYMGVCPIQPYIPIYLLVLGCLSLLLMLAVPIGFCLGLSGHRNITICFCIWIAVDAIFLLCWFITGNVWIFSIYEPNYNNPTSDQYCHETVYQWAFWNTIVVDLILALFLSCGCCYLVFLLLRFINGLFYRVHYFIIRRFYHDEGGQTDPLIATGSRGAEAVPPTPAIYGC